jgi:hypothetical protein
MHLEEDSRAEEITMLFDHFNFPELRTFSFNLRIPFYSEIRKKCAKVARNIQRRRWNRLESGQFAIEVWIDDMFDDDVMLGEIAVWVSVSTAIA